MITCHVPELYNSNLTIIISLMFLTGVAQTVKLYINHVLPLANLCFSKNAPPSSATHFKRSINLQ